jgi:hypothetical protein
MGPVLDEPDNFLADSERYAKLGISQWDLMPDRHPVEYTERLAELVPRLVAL